MEIETKSYYYNYYNVKGRYTPDEPQKAGWVKRFESVEDRIEGDNSSKDSELYKAYVKLEDIYYNVSVANRTKYSTYKELKSAIGQKYFAVDSPYYKKYTAAERRAMYDNELEMSAFGTCGNMSDPRLKGKVHAETDSEKKRYNRQCVNKQIYNIFTNNGISESAFANSSLSFFINPYTYRLTVEGDADKSVMARMEELLNENGNAKELFFYIMNSIGSANINRGVMAKYRIASQLQEYTDLHIQDFMQTKDGLVDKDGNSILDVFKEKIRESSKIPFEFKGAAYDNFEKYVKQIAYTDINSIDDMYLGIGFENGQLKDISNGHLVQTGFHAAF